MYRRVLAGRGLRIACTSGSGFRLALATTSLFRSCSLDTRHPTVDGRNPIGNLGEVGRVYAPALLANAKALMAGEKEWETKIDGANWKQQSFAYQGKCLQWINERYQALSDDDKTRVDKVLAGTGCEALIVT